MTWPAFAVYVGAAAVIGTLFVALAFFAESADSWGREGRWIRGFLLIYGLAFAGGFAVQVLFALLLYGLTRALRLQRLAAWAAWGAALGIALPWLLARLGYIVEGLYFSADLQRVKAMLMFFLVGPIMLAGRPAWVLALVGAVTGASLRLLVSRLAAAPPEAG